jgi:uncharacterized protein YjbJ (UPF0337 family)
MWAAGRRFAVWTEKTLLMSYVRVRTVKIAAAPYSVFQDMPNRGMCTLQEHTMNKDQVNGKLQDIGGKIQEEAGKLVGNPDQQVKGLKNQVEGKTQEKIGDLKEAIKDATN